MDRPETREDWLRPRRQRLRGASCGPLACRVAHLVAGASAHICAAAHFRDDRITKCVAIQQQHGDCVAAPTPQVSRIR
jgi:hypothetical protein